MAKYTAKTSIAMTDGRRARGGDVIELTDEEARPLHKTKAIGLYLADGEEASDELPKAKPRRKVRSGKPAGGPATLDVSATLDVDPRAQ